MARGGSEGGRRALGAALVRLRAPLAAALASAAATAAAFVIFSENRPKFLSRRAREIDSTSPFAETPLPDLPPPRDIKSFAYAVLMRSAHDNMSLVAAGVAFYLLLAVFPALITFLSIYGLFLNPTTAADQVQAATDILPPEAARLIIDVIKNLAARSSGDLNATAALSLLIATWSARSGIGALMTGINIANDTSETRSYLHLEMHAIILTIGALIGVALAMSAITAVPVALRLLPTTQATDAWVLWGRWPVLAIFAYTAISILYKVAPARVVHTWRFFNVGAAAATTMWFAGSLIFSYYVTRIGSFDRTYGSIGAVVILLFWFWLSALFVLLGAEIEAELAEVELAREDKQT